MIKIIFMLSVLLFYPVKSNAQEQFAVGNIWTYSKSSSFANNVAYAGNSSYDSIFSLIHIEISSASKLGDTSIQFTAVIADTIFESKFKYSGDTVKSQSVVIDTVNCVTNGKSITYLKHSAVDTAWSKDCLLFLLIPQNALDSISSYAINNIRHELVQSGTDSTYYLKGIGFFYFHYYRFSMLPHASSIDFNEIKLISFNNNPINVYRTPIKYSPYSFQLHSQTLFLINFDNTRNRISATFPSTAKHSRLEIGLFNASGKRIYSAAADVKNGILNIKTLGFPAGKYFLSIYDNNNTWASSFVLTK